MTNSRISALWKEERKAMKNLIMFVLVCTVILCGLAASSCTKAKNDDVSQIQALEKNLIDSFNSKDVNGVMAAYLPDENLIVFDCTPPRQFVGTNALRKDYEAVFANYPGPLHAELIDFKIQIEGNMGYGTGLFHGVGTDKDGKPSDLTMRETDVYHKVNGKWFIVHAHDSFPVDLTTGKADFTSKP
jgi:ketosteroid isomerase-like protein